MAWGACAEVVRLVFLEGVASSVSVRSILAPATPSVSSVGQVGFEATSVVADLTSVGPLGHGVHSTRLIFLLCAFGFRKSECGWQWVPQVWVWILSMQDAEIDISEGDNVMSDIEGAIANGSSRNTELLEIRSHEVHG